MAEIEELSKALPKDDSIARLPLSAQVAFGARSARRAREQLRAVWPELETQYVEPIESAVRVAEMTDADPDEAASWARRSQAIWTNGGAVDFAGAIWSLAAKSAASAAAACAVAGRGGPRDQVVNLVCGAAKDSASIDSYRKYSRNEQLLRITQSLDNHTSTAHALVSDFKLLSHLARKEHWEDKTPVPKGVFLAYSTFDIRDMIQGQSVLEISSLVNERLIAYFREDPERLFELHPRQFEELIAELFDAFGFAVTLLAGTKDGGRDIIAIGKQQAQVKYLIECKRYSRHRRVGVEIVRGLHGVTQMEQATKGIIATTSYFTKPAQEAIRKVCWQLEGRDFGGVVDWLTEYDRCKMAGIFLKR